MTPSLKHHKTGSPFPEKTPGKLRVYSMRFCPYAQRARLVLAHKNIDHEIVNVSLSEKPEWFLERTSVGAVPVAELDDKVVAESVAVCEWLDDVYPENRLTPSDPYKKARDRMLLEYFPKVTTAFYSILFKKGDADQLVEDILKHYQFFEDALKARGTKYFGGDKVAMLDFLLWPHTERNSLLLAEVEPRTLITKEKYPKLSEWIDAMLQEPAVKATILDKELHLHFGNAFFSKQPLDYDYKLKE